MTIAFGAIGAKAEGQATVAVPYPASVGAGDLLIAGRCAWRPVTVTATDESGWTPAGDLFGGTGTATDAHTSRIRGDYSEAAGGETGTVTFDTSAVDGSTTDAVIGVMARYTKGSGTWDVATETGDDIVHDADRAVTLSSAHTVAVGDWLVALVAVDTDGALTITSPTFTGTATFGTVNARTNGTGGSALGRDGNIEVFDVEVTGAGTCTGFTMTCATTTCGPVDILRLRETSSGGGGDAEVVAVAATGTGLSLAPALSAGSTVLAAVAIAIGGAAIPVVSEETVVSGGGPATATAQAYPPTVSAGDGASVTGVQATATAAAIAPTVTGASADTVLATTATATARARPPVVTTTRSVEILATVAIATARARAPMVEVIEPTFFFSPPTHEEPIRTRLKPLVYFRLTWAQSVVRVGGNFVQITTPLPELLEGLEEGVDFFRGGYEYEVSRATADELTAAGYSVTPI